MDRSRAESKSSLDSGGPGAKAWLEVRKLHQQGAASAPNLSRSWHPFSSGLQAIVAEVQEVSPVAQRPLFVRVMRTLGARARPPGRYLTHASQHGRTQF